MDWNAMKQNIEQFMKENEASATSQASLIVLTKEVFSDYPQELLEEFFDAEPAQYSSTKSIEPGTEKTQVINVQLPAELFQGIPQEVIPDYLTGLVQENRRKLSYMI